MKLFQKMHTRVMALKAVSSSELTKRKKISHSPVDMFEGYDNYTRSFYGRSITIEVITNLYTGKL